MRKIGIDDLGNMAWGSHLCLFYETKEDLFESVVIYFRAGLKRNEFCVWAVSGPVTVEDAKAALSGRIHNFDKYFAAGSIEIIPGREWYLKAGQFDPERVTRSWNKKLEDALSRGYSGMRASRDAFCLATKQWHTLIEYERELDRVVAGQPLTILRTFALPVSRACDLLDVVSTHKFTVVRRHGSWEPLEIPSTDRIKAPARSERDAAIALAGLSPREREVLKQLAHGATNREIAARLGISERTVEVYRARLLLKTKARNVQGLVRLAILGGIDRRTTRATRGR